MRPDQRYLIAALAILAGSSAVASSGGGGGLPRDGPRQQIQQSFTRLAAVTIAGGMLIFGGELHDFARRLISVVLVAGILPGATQIVGLFGTTGASIGSSPDSVGPPQRLSGEGRRG